MIILKLFLGSKAKEDAGNWQEPNPPTKLPKGSILVEGPQGLPLTITGKIKRK